MHTVTMPVFRDEIGNKFVVPNIFAYGDRVIQESKCNEVQEVLGLTNDDSVEFNVASLDDGIPLPRFEADCADWGHDVTGIQLWLIGGPTFDERLLTLSSKSS